MLLCYNLNTTIMKKPILYFDMDNVLVDFQSGIDATPPEVLAQYADDGLTHTNVCARREQRPSSLGLCRAAAKRLLKTNVCARREQKPSLLGLCQAAPIFVQASAIFVQASAIFVQASAEPNLFGLCRAQPKMSRNRACSYCRAQPKMSRKGAFYMSTFKTAPQALELSPR